MDESKGKVFLHHRVRIILIVTIQYTIAVCTLNCCFQVDDFSDCSFFSDSLPAYSILNFADF